MGEQTKRTSLTDVLTSMRLIGDDIVVPIPPDWKQGRAIYGGLSASICVAAARKRFGDLSRLRSAQISFIGPSAAKGVLLTVTKLRQGSSAAFVNVDMHSDGEPVMRATLCFGSSRDSKFSLLDLPAPAVAPVENCAPFFEAGPAPDFAVQFNSRWAAGAIPGSGADHGDICAWLQHKDAAARNTEAGLVALADGLPPAAMSMFTEGAPVSTMTWMFDMLTDDPQTRDGWWLSRNLAHSSIDGYSSQIMTLWNTDGVPVLMGQQNCAIFA